MTINQLLFKKTKYQALRAGYSILELVLVFMVIGAMIGGIYLAGSRLLDRARTNTTKNKLQTVRLYIENFYQDVGQYPQSLNDLVTKPQGEIFEKWDGPYAKAVELKDSWDRKFVYRPTPDGKHPYELDTKTPRGTKLSVWEE